MTLAMSRLAPAALVVLRTLIGWHFLYEGYFKLMQPVWSAAGAPLPAWSASGFLHAASGPFSGLFRMLAEPPWLAAVDVGIPLALVAIGLCLMVGLFTQTATAAAVLLLLTFYLAAIPLSGVPEPRAEGAYLIVNKTLVEAAASLVLLTARTGSIAGLDLVVSKRARLPRAAQAAA